MQFKDFEQGAMCYCEKHVLPKLRASVPDWKSWKDWGLYGILALIGLNFEAIVEQNKPMLLSFGVMDQSGNINIDLLEKAGIAAFEKQPDLSIFGCTFHRGDLDDLMKILRGQTA